MIFNKIKLKNLFLALLTSLIFNSQLTFSASGIPTYDAAAVAKMIAQISMLTNQFNELKQHTTKLQSQIDLMTGPRGLGTALNDTTLFPALPNDWKDVLTQIKTSSHYTTERALFPTSSSTTLNNYYDQLASENAVITSLYEKTNKRLSQVQSLMGLIDTANDPAAKMDLQNRIASEQTVISTTTQLIELMKVKHEHDLEHVARIREKEKICAEFKITPCV